MDASPLVRTKWTHRPIVVLVLLFLVLGPLGLPYLWQSPHFSRRWKIVLTWAVAAYTAFLMIETVRVFRAVQEQLDGLDGLQDL